MRRWLFQAHWIAGITAGLVLAVVGVTGAMLSFQDELVRWMNPALYQARAGGGRLLTPAELADLMLKLQNETHCHNINLVTPEHVVPQVWREEE